MQTEDKDIIFEYKFHVQDGERSIEAVLSVKDGGGWKLKNAGGAGTDLPVDMTIYDLANILGDVAKAQAKADKIKLLNFLGMNI